MQDKTRSIQALLIVVDPGSGVPVYRQVMDQVKFQIAGGMLQPLDELPSTRSLSVELGINPMTISKAYSFLEKEGVVERRPGRATIVTNRDQEGRSVDRLALLKQSLKHPVTMIRQLGIDSEQALTLLREMLRTDGNNPAQADEQSEGERS